MPYDIKLTNEDIGKIFYVESHSENGSCWYFHVGDLIRMFDVGGYFELIYSSQQHRIINHDKTFSQRIISDETGRYRASIRRIDNDAELALLMI